MITLSPAEARSLAVRAQLLSGSRPPANAQGIMTVARRLGRLQLDPTNVVARSHLLVLWSRLGSYDPENLERLLWRERRPPEHPAVILPTEGLPLYRWFMRRFPAGGSPWPRPVATFLGGHAPPAPPRLT